MAMAAGADEGLERLHQQLTAISAREAEAILEAVIADVRERATPMIRRLLLESLIGSLDAAVATAERASPVTATGERSAPGEPPRSAPRPASGTVVYVYGVTTADAALAPDARGYEPVGGAPLFMLKSGRLAAIASLVPEAEFGADSIDEQLDDVAWVERNARAHDAVLRAVAASGPPVVPLRFGTLYRSQEAVLTALEDSGAALASTLAELEGRTEWVVSAVISSRAPDPAAPIIAAPNRPGAGVSYLEARRAEPALIDDFAERVERCAAACVDRLRTALQGASVAGLATRPATGGGTTEIARAACLLRRREMNAFLSVIDALEADFAHLDLGIHVDGPLPPYHFVARDLAAAEPACG
jgi:hypothetical protein